MIPTARPSNARIRGTALGLLALCVCISNAKALDAVEKFYRGKAVTLIVPSSVGGGYDLYGRLVARHLGRFIPGNPQVNPSNMAGAAGVVAAQYIYAAGAKDGTTIGELYPNAVMEPLLGDRARVKYDSLRFNFIGSLNSDAFICFARAGAEIRKFEDAFSKEVVLGATGSGAPSTDYPAMYDNLLGAKFKIVNGYPGITEIGLALEKGEIDGTCGSSWSVMTTGHPDWLRDGKMRVLAQENTKANPEIAKLGAPLTVDFAKTPEQRAILEFVFAQSTFGRPFVMAPETPPERVEAMRKAFSAMVADAEFLAEAAKLKLEIVDPMDGARLTDAVTKLMATPADIVDKTKVAIVPKR
jgi:tripartite-type tricarboxylate transporter receptor subunit TctC